MKQCSRCKVSLPLLKFSKDKYRKDGFSNSCKSCDKLIHLNWVKSNPERARASWRAAYQRYDSQNARWKRKYGIDREYYAALLKSQNGRCAVCEEPMQRPNVDHDHQTGKIRGLLCTPCNQGLGHFRDSVIFLRNASYYLIKYAPVAQQIER